MMRRQPFGMKSELGVMLIEALLAILIFSVGILAIVGMQGVAVKEVTQAKFRSEAGFLADDLLAQMWGDNANIASYNYAGTGTVPSRLTNWVTRAIGDGTPTNPGRLPGAVAPIVTVTGASAQGGTVQIQVFWIMPEEASKGLPPHEYRAIATVYTS